MTTEHFNYPLDASQYKLLDCIGRGATSEVYAAQCLANNSMVAIKLVNLEAYPLEIEFLRQEVAFWSSTQHEQVVQYYGSFVSGPMLYILMEYMAGGSVSDIMRFSYPKGFPDESVIATILLAILKALDYIHSHNELHRDVKPGNALIGSDGKVKIGDFGVAATLLENGQRRRARYTVIGTPCYMAPEILQEELGYTQKADIWSFGITAIELATGSAPYSNLQPLAVVQKILKAPPPHLTVDQGFSPELCNLVKLCLNHDPTKRPSAQELLQLPFFKKVQSPDYIKDAIVNKLPSLEKRYGKTNSNSPNNFVQSAPKPNTDWDFGDSKPQIDILTFNLPQNQQKPQPQQQQQQQQQGLQQQQVQQKPVQNDQKENDEGVRKGRFKVTKQPSNPVQQQNQQIPQSASLPSNVTTESSTAGLEAVVASLTEKVVKLSEENQQIRAEIRSLLEAVQSLGKK
ncbi:STE20/SPS1-related proline-alanine-rich protein kinase [Tritrichomonas foetus]|uniref:STE20/SPS1-related proline-alanine-rich protein kinase n=1 Tax=Tritrichomonas foetus TaxID=1144522 RepID=A0A1J4K2W6_9EUKA|nr:STE20/SPS1-related proline-alanine-rich protein kinase [Tritrichomonas foetus]|eukprot:OHT05539.1 STE20/SPS1-related proline-alanine-rich protein kinase [Tritrichomonas foetus]